ncbi:MAG: beta-ketoacyl-[acyl-carrier-protein] synthase family protein [Polyangiaceae bacterium]|nr:beta-ketoacyl-[acyl-carrier-protein] synthase family protein [Polyangiaceae bacterium]
MSRHRVVVTGMGVVSPLGNRVDAFCEALLAGRSGIAEITSFDASNLPTHIAGEAQLPSDAPLGDRKIAFALEAARQALEDAGRGASSGSSEIDAHAGVSLGVGLELFNMPDLVRSRAPGFELPDELAQRLGFMQTPSDVCVHAIAARHGLGAAPEIHVSACAAGTDALGHALRLIASGRRRWVLAGGTDSMINPLGVAGFCALGATSTRNAEPTRASRPFDTRRDGFVMGEGAGMLVLERLSDARARGARIYAELAGFGSSFDAFKIADPHPEGRGAWQAMARALSDARLEAKHIDYVNAHGTSTPKNDPAETLAIKRLLDERAHHVAISSTKSMIGHLISAAGAVEAVATIACMLRGQVHPTINLEEPDPSCDLDYVPEGARSVDVRHAISSSYGFGGHNASIVLRHPAEIDNWSYDA